MSTVDEIRQETERVLGEQQIEIIRREASFDRACDEAVRSAYRRFQVDEDGHSPLKGWERSDSWIEVTFDKVILMGDQILYTFNAVAKKNIEDEEDDDESV